MRPKTLVAAAAFGILASGLALAGDKKPMDICVWDNAFQTISLSRSRWELIWNGNAQPTDAEVAAQFASRVAGNQALRAKLYPLLHDLHATHIAFAFAKKCGAREMTYYQLTPPPALPLRWNTAILNPDLTPMPSFLALKAWAARQ